MSNRAIQTAAPEWWTRDLWKTLHNRAQQAFPNEVCGLIHTALQGVDVHCFLEGTATPSSCLAARQDVIDFAFTLEAAGGSVLATFHSHPLGFPQLSARDAGLSDWAQLHVLLVRQNQLWHPHWFTMKKA